jgi:hypothetical protein
MTKRMICRITASRVDGDEQELAARLEHAGRLGQRPRDVLAL